MTTVAIICSAMLGLTGLLCLIRIVRGPTMLDRTVASDVVIAATLAGVGLEAAISRSTDTVPVLLVLALVGFVGSLSIARFAATSPAEPPKPDLADRASSGPAASGPARKAAADSDPADSARPQSSADPDLPEATP